VGAAGLQGVAGSAAFCNLSPTHKPRPPHIKLPSAIIPAPTGLPACLPPRPCLPACRGGGSVRAVQVPGSVHHQRPCSQPLPHTPGRFQHGRRVCGQVRRRGLWGWQCTEPFGRGGGKGRAEQREAALVPPACPTTA
jgi:hypothetical protein